ncbi:MAG: ABC transporter ATP-binding protein [Thermoguttaceae bacterium]
MSEAPAGPQGPALWRLEGVDKRFQTGQVVVQALRDVSLQIREGEFLVLIGPSGSGKTTLLNILGGIDTPSAGKIWFRDEDLTTLGPAELTRYRRETIGFVFQFYNLIPNLTARENVMVATELSRRPMDVAEALRLVGLQQRMDHFPSQLSGGEQQRVAIARAIAKDPAVLLCDEPTGAVDYASGIRVLRLLIDLKEQLGKTIVWITHNAAIAAAADRVVRLRSGQVVEVRSNPAPVPPEEITW